MKIIMDEIMLCSMTRELCHRFFRDFENDPAVFCNAERQAEEEKRLTFPAEKIIFSPIFPCL